MFHLKCKCVRWKNVHSTVVGKNILQLYFGSNWFTMFFGSLFFVDHVLCFSNLYWKWHIRVSHYYSWIAYFSLHFCQFFHVIRCIYGYNTHSWCLDPFIIIKCSFFNVKLFLSISILSYISIGALLSFDIVCIWHIILLSFHCQPICIFVYNVYLLWELYRLCVFVYLTNLCFLTAQFNPFMCIHLSIDEHLVWLHILAIEWCCN